MDRKALARKIVDAIFDDAEAEGRVLHRDRITDIAEKILTAELPNANPWLRPACGASAPISAEPNSKVAEAVSMLMAWIVQDMMNSDDDAGAYVPIQQDTVTRRPIVYPTLLRPVSD